MRPRLSLLVDFSTIEVDRCRGFATRLKAGDRLQLGRRPVSGGPVASGNGTLTVMAGGAPEDIERLRPFFDAIAGNFTHVGKTGDGLVAKMVSQLIVGCLHVVLAEAERLAELSGIDASAIPGLCRRRPCRWRPAATALPADRGAGFQAAGLCPPARQGSAHGRGAGGGGRHAGSDAEPGKPDVRGADRRAAIPSSIPPPWSRCMRPASAPPARREPITKELPR